ncbi:MAG: phosphatidylserine decarboxylase, partial [Gammaproteobacteria bacterium]|nr:phosphatidylserine decarboxylase [Gammaproteobacteria bacterium]
KKGEEMGRFKLGSTVVLLMQKDNWNWHKDVADEADIKLGAALIAKK